MSNSNKVKAAQLGMPYGTACGRLRKALLFKLATQLGLTSCYRCGEVIADADSFSIDHKKVWLHTSPDLFWDLDNIAFSHLHCNIADRRRVPGIPKKQVIDGKLQCSICCVAKPPSEFYSDKRAACGRSSSCKSCESDRMREYRSNRRREVGREL